MYTIISSIKVYIQTGKEMWNVNLRKKKVRKLQATGNFVTTGKNFKIKNSYKRVMLMFKSGLGNKETRSSIVACFLYAYNNYHVFSIF